MSQTTVENLNAVTIKTSENFVVQGYVFLANSTFQFVTPNGKRGSFSLGSDMNSAKILFVSGRTIYLASDSGIYRADLSKVFSAGQTEVECQKIVDISGVESGAAFAFDGEFIYFYSTLQEVPEDKKDDDNDEETEETDSNLYLHRARVTATNEFELLGKTSIQSRRTK